MARITIEDQNGVRVYESDSYVFVALASNVDEEDLIPVIEFSTTDEDFEDLINFAEEEYYDTDEAE